MGFLTGLWALLAGFAGEPSAPPPDSLIAAARDGDQQAREDLIRQYLPLVLKVGAQVSGRYLRVGQDEEISVGMLAINEAIDRYDPERGASFLTFAEMVIRRRLMDYYRRQRGGREIPLSELQGEDEEGNPLAGAEEREALIQHAAELEAEERREEIAQYARRLLEFGIRLRDLVRESPRHADARERAIACARLVAETPALREHLLRRRELPLKALEAIAPVSRKTLERQRRYIIAVALIWIDGYTHLQRYLEPLAGGSRDGGGEGKWARESSWNGTAGTASS
ncbi:MAG: RNA polymerase sigma factor SigI [Bacillota bacterium]